MNKKILALLCLLIIVPLTLTGCKFFKKDTTPTEEQQEETFNGSLDDLIKRGKPTKCTYSTSDENVDVNGTVYVADKKARQDTEAIEDGKKIEIHTIVDDRTVWFWSSENPGQGMKMYIDETEEELKEFGENFQNAQAESDLSQKMEFKCTAWQVDSSKFEVPNDIEFMDMSKMFEDMGNMMGDGPENINRDLEDMDSADLPDSSNDARMEQIKQMMCDSCDNTPNPEECRTNFGCE